MGREFDSRPHFWVVTLDKLFAHVLSASQITTPLRYGKLINLNFNLMVRGRPNNLINFTSRPSHYCLQKQPFQLTVCRLGIKRSRQYNV